MLQGVILAEKIIQPIEQVFQAQESPDAFVKRIFVQNQWVYPCNRAGWRVGNLTRAALPER